MKTAILHQLKIARSTLKLIFGADSIMGGMTKSEAWTLLERYGNNDDRVNVKDDKEYCNSFNK